MVSGLHLGRKFEDNISHEDNKISPDVCITYDKVGRQGSNLVFDRHCCARSVYIE